MITAILQCYISIHAPARGASDIRSECRHSFRFQFTPLREGLQRSQDMKGYMTLFQFTPLREGLHEFNCKFNDSILFQFTPLREGLPGCDVGRRNERNFNSRPCERGFDLPDSSSGHPVLFQFTPLREGLRLCRR